MLKILVLEKEAIALLLKAHRYLTLPSFHERSPAREGDAS